MRQCGSSPASLVCFTAASHGYRNAARSRCPCPREHHDPDHRGSEEQDRGRHRHTFSSRPRFRLHARRYSHRLRRHAGSERSKLILSRLDDAVARLRHLVPDARQIPDRLRDNQPGLVRKRFENRAARARRTRREAPERRGGARSTRFTRVIRPARGGPRGPCRGTTLRSPARPRSPTSGCWRGSTSSSARASSRPSPARSRRPAPAGSRR